MSPIRMSRIETTVRVVLAFNEAFNKHDITGMMKQMSDSCVYETAGGPAGTVFTGKEAIAQYWREFFAQNPDRQIEGEDVFGLGFRTVFRWRSEWKDAHGQQKLIRGVDIFHVKEGLIQQQYSYVKAPIP